MFRAVDAPVASHGRALSLGLTLAGAAFIYIEAMAHLAGNAWGWPGTGLRLMLTAGTLALALLAPPFQRGKDHWSTGWVGPATFAATIALWVLAALTESTAAAWLALIGYFAVSFWLAEMIVDGQKPALAWVIRLPIGLGFVLGPIAFDQMATHFADEEFFAALQAAQLAPWWIALEAGAALLARPRAQPGPTALMLDIRWTRLALGALAILGGAVTIHAYQSSFYPAQAPSYPGISAALPFECGTFESQGQAYDGLLVHRDLLSAVEANPRKASPEFGMLALGTGEAQWAQAFRSSLLEEAAAGLYTTPANSVKSVQQEAALRAYYYPRVAAVFPDLFADDDTARLRTWFAEINRRALRVEWVDLLYGLAFAQWPEGPYANQENGAGLLAMLEAGGLAAPDLAQANIRYLEREERGWLARFRNTDDAYIYQPEWITNAYFQSLYAGTPTNENMARAFEWLLLQALPDGSAPAYNHPSEPSLAGTAYLGAVLLQDPRYVWLAGRALEALRPSGGDLTAQPGAERAVDLAAQAPGEKSCLVYGDSGLPTQVGPLAPDKIVMRSGWEADSLYLLLNLRFSGWHRYKATGTLTMLHQDQPLVTEDSLAAPSSWLPRGRSLFRDKRIPRENLNGLVVERRGMNQVLAIATGVGGRWAQDPPYYAQVERFEPGQDYDRAEIALSAWHGWQHTRTIMLYDEGIVVVVDEATGPKDSQAAIRWHLPEGSWRDGERIILYEGENSASLILLTPESVTADGLGRTVDVSIVSSAGHVCAVSVFLTGAWAEAEVAPSPDGRVLTLAGPDERSIALPLE